MNAPAELPTGFAKESAYCNLAVALSFPRRTNMKNVFELNILQTLEEVCDPLRIAMTRLLLYALPATLLSQRPGFQVRYARYLSVLSIFF